MLQKEWTWHLLFWGLFLFIRIAVIQLYPGPLPYRLGMELVELPLKAAALYVAIFVLIRRLLIRQRYAAFAGVFILYLLAVMALNRLEDYYLVYPLTHSEHTRYKAGLWNLRAAFYNLIYIYPVVGLGAAVYFVKSWYENQLRMEQLVKEKYEAELMLLRKQVHPHFLFNTLNNIYALSLTQSPRAPEMIHRLSELLSYMLYDSEWPRVALKAEWQILEHYAQLERIRLLDRLELVMNASGHLDGHLISHLLLLPFVENAFKHGGQTAAENCWISCYLHVEKNRLTFQIENSLPTGDTIAQQGKSGLGLRNVQNRLALAYPGKHELQIHTTDTYLVRLNLQLD